MENFEPFGDGGAAELVVEEEPHNPEAIQFTQGPQNGHAFHSGHWDEARRGGGFWASR
jgi:hypothetical protein